MKRAIIILLTFLPNFSFSQQVLSGTVLDDSLKTPIPYVWIYFPEIKTGCVADENGKFSIGNLPNGKTIIQFSHLGYKSLVLEFDHTKDISQIFYLKESQFVSSDVVVYGEYVNAPEKTVNNIQTLDAVEMRNAGAINLSDGIAKLPGVSQLTTGAGISKPVIRGLYGNRILTVLSGLRFDNQQWQDEHGLGLSDVGIDRIEIIKGPASLLYGSEAMGGVLNIIEEKPAPVNETKFDFSTRFFSNTIGYATEAGVKSSGSRFSWRVRAGTESHADYSDGNNKRVLNSRFGGYYGKASLGYRSKKWVSNNDYFFALSNFGFLMDPIQLLDPPDNRLSRSFDRPHHSVILNVFSSQNTFFLPKSKIKITGGYLFNNRQEQEGGNRISLNMVLSTAVINALWIKNFNDKWEFNIGTQNFYQTNKNLGSRTIVPDALQSEFSLFSYLRYSAKYIAVEGGIRYDHRSIQTFETGTINTDPNSPGSEILPFNRKYQPVNASIGLSIFDLKKWNFKTNISSGYRPGNLAELSSNGLHEGTVRYEIGNTEMKTEQNFCADATLTFSSPENLTFYISVYANRFQNYIYLAPTDLEYIGFDIFRYLQKNALLTGTEVYLNIHPKKLKGLQWISSYAITIGRTDDGEYLPFIPAGKINSDLKYNFPSVSSLKNIFVRPGITYTFSQNHPDQFETPTDDYYLINFAAGIEIPTKKNTIILSIAGNNVLNNAYYDHLSRFKYFGVYNIGRNISLNFKIMFN